MKISLTNIRVFMSLLLTIIVIASFAGCGTEPSGPAGTFEEFLDRQFERMVTSDSITFRYTLKDPEQYGIARIEPTLGEFNFDAYMKEVQESEKALEELKRFTYNELSDDEKLTYDIFKYHLETGLDYDAEGLYYYNSYLSPTIGIQVQLPILLSEYRLYNENDARDYLALLTDIDRYYQDILDFEREKSALGLFMADFTLDAVMAGCNEFIESGERNFLIETFDLRVDGLELTDEQKAAFKEENKSKVLDEVIPAYTRLVDGLEELRGTGVNDAGLCYFERGGEYYELMVRSDTDSDKSIQEIAAMIDDAIFQAIITFQTIFSETPDVFDYMQEPDFGYTDPIEIIEAQRRKMSAYYPPAADVSYTLKYTPPSFEEHSSPAFYLTPPIDDYKNNVMYINNKHISDSSSLFSLLAHEGFPGHLYQITYFTDNLTHPIRSMFNFSGYVEGWATYAEADSFRLAEFPAMGGELAEIFRADQIFAMAIQSRADIGVNYEGWLLEDIGEYLSYYGLDGEVGKIIYEYVIQNPGNYQKYMVGYLEFMELRAFAQDKLGGSFSPLEFHRSVLDVGSAPFAIVRGAVERYAGA